MTKPIDGVLVLLPECWNNIEDQKPEVHGAIFRLGSTTDLTLRTTRIAIDSIDETSEIATIDWNSLPRLPGHPNSRNSQKIMHLRVLTHDDSSISQFLTVIRQTLAAEKFDRNSLFESGDRDFIHTGKVKTQSTGAPELIGRPLIEWTFDKRASVILSLENYIHYENNHFLVVDSMKYSIDPKVLTSVQRLFLGAIDEIAVAFQKTHKEKLMSLLHGNTASRRVTPLQSGCPEKLLFLGILFVCIILSPLLYVKIKPH